MTPMASRLAAGVTTVVLVTGGVVVAQEATGTRLAELVTLKSRVGNADTRTRVEAFHRVWAIGLTSAEPEVKLSALDLMTEPVGSASDHIRMPAVYAIAEIANSTDDERVKIRAIRALGEPLAAGQVPIRVAAIDAINSITVGTTRDEVVLAAVSALGSPLRSGNNGVRIPAINGIMRAVGGGHSNRAAQAAIDLLAGPLESNAMIGGLELRMMAIVAMERAGVIASDIGTKAKAMGLLQSYVTRSGWEEEAKRRARDGAAAIQTSMKP